ncbi:MAG: hypothetical protein PHW96_00095 [Candidatus Nanoarchaeia archaeon]|nr:hypothetical protein [Candidatus Nanoarchaeia archaeon]
MTKRKKIETKQTVSKVIDDIEVLKEPLKGLSEGVNKTKPLYNKQNITTPGNIKSPCQKNKSNEITDLLKGVDVSLFNINDMELKLVVFKTGYWLDSDESYFIKPNTVKKRFMDYYKN